uniref:Zinc finger PHD-type domain-containing protein n=1 Tax=Caenorhabditis nigoni TaxID=1611254 RepID=A0A2G5TX05_9PELO|nr:hypothetical protein B9Z55_012284 [Caenorhabditis nigoni]
MVNTSKSRKARQANGRLALNRRADNLERRNCEIEDEIEEKDFAIRNIIVSMILISSDVTKFQKDSEMKKKEIDDILKYREEKELELKFAESEIKKLKAQRLHMINENKRREKQLENLKTEKEEFQSSDKPPKSRKSQIPFDLLKDRKSKITRCMDVVEFITNVVKSDSIERFLRFFFQFLNDSENFKFRYQMNDEETYFAKIRFHLPHSFFTVFQKFYYQLTGFNVFSSRHDIAEIQKRLSLIRFYSVESQEIEKKTLSGSITHVYRPLVYINALEEVISIRLSTMARYSTLIFDQSTGDDICISLGGDKGGEETKLFILFENILKPNDSRSLLLLGFYTGDDDHDSLEKNFSSVFVQFNNLKCITYNDGSIEITKTVRKKVIGDVKFLLSLYDHPGPQCLTPCPKCVVRYSNHGSRKATLDSFTFEISAGFRTVESYKEIGSPLIDVDPADSVIPPMHVFQGLVQKYAIDFLVSHANILDFGEEDFPSRLDEQKRKVKDLEFEESIYIKRMENTSKELDDIRDVSIAYNHIVATGNTKKSKNSCESTFCVLKYAKSRSIERDTYQCDRCSKIFHYICNGVFTFDQKSKTNQAGNNVTCFDCSDNPLTIQERMEEVEIWKAKLEKSQENDQDTWWEVNEEKRKAEKVITDRGDSGEYREKLDKFFKNTGCENYNCSKNWTGNMTRRFLRKCHIDEVIGIFPSTSRLEAIRHFLYQLESLMSSANNEVKSDEQISEIQNQLEKMVKFLREAHPDYSVTVKLHLLTSHLLEFVRKHRSWGKVSEQGIEHAHSDFKKLHMLLAPMKNPISKGIAIVDACAGANFLIDSEIFSENTLKISARSTALFKRGICAGSLFGRLCSRHSENQELLVRQGIERIEDAIKSSSRLRGAFYEHLKLVLQQRKRSEEIRFFVEWSQNLLSRFKEDFFEFQESIDEESTWILKPPPERLQEVIPMFELVLEMEHLKMRWKEEDEEHEGMSNDTVVTKDLDFAFEALLPSQDEDLPTDRDQKLDHLFFLIQWSRSVLNAFLTHSSSDDVAKIAIRQFKGMMEAEKKLAAGLGSGATWHVPNLEFKEITVSGPEKPKAKGGNRKRKSDETTIIGAGDGAGEDLLAQEAEEEEDETEKNVPNITLKSHFTCLRLRPLVHILKLAQKKRGCLKYLCDELQTVFDQIARSKKKAPPMLAARAIPNTQKIDAFYHGDAATVWFCVRKATEHIWEIVESMFHFFSTLADASQQPSVQMQKDLEELGEKSLKLMHCLLSGDLYGGEEKLSAVEKADRKSVIIRIIEKKMFGLERLSNDEEEARVEIGKFLAKSAEFSPTPAVAVALLNVFDDLKLDEEEQAETRKVMAKYALAYLKKDWSKVDEQWSRGTKYTNAVKDILQHYIGLRREKDQLLAIQWILTNKVVQLVPEDDKRKSCVFSQQSDDEMLEKEDKKAVFYCISKTTFGVIFKTLFGCLNARCLKYDMSGIAAKNRLVDEDETLESWEIASSCFLILCLFLRINKIRTTAVLTTAIREGKQFLITVSRKSSFIYLMENITKGTNFDVVCRRVEKILSAVQQGNRVLQSIGTYAKTQKCVHLLKRFPELRAENENCLRVIHSAMVKNECLNAFTVGLVKSRSIDGEIITNQPDSPMDSDDE